MERIYLDNAATTPLRPEVVQKMTEVLSESFGNPSSTHSFGRSPRAIIENARKNIAKWIQASPGEIFFTSGGTEADNMVLTSMVRDVGVRRIISSRIEHHAILHALEHLENKFSDLQIDFVLLKPLTGEIDYDHLEDLLQNSPAKTLVTLMAVNNEIGNKLDIKRVGQLCASYDAYFHTDAVQWVGHFPIDVQALNIDALAASAHKFHGPKGTGFAYIKKGLGIKPLIYGGDQERGMRAGTEATHDIAGIDLALSLAYQNLELECSYLTELKRHFINKLKQAIPSVTFNGQSGDLDLAAYNIINVCLPCEPSKEQLLLFHLDLQGIACSRGSACQSGAIEISHVLKEILPAEKYQEPSLRFSLSIYNTKEQLDYVVQALAEYLK